MTSSPPVFLIPAYQAEASIASVVEGVLEAWPGERPEQPIVIVIDDGSTDSTADRARAAGAEVLEHDQNRGKGAALRTGLERARDLGAKVAVSLDADGQHPPDEAVRLFFSEFPLEAIVVGVRDLAAAGAPKKNQGSNAFSNRVISFFAGRRLTDTQCGLRRYPVEETLALRAKDSGYAYEAEVLLRAARSGRAIEHLPIRVIYPPESERVTHFHSVRDPARIVRRVLSTVASVPPRGFIRRTVRALLLTSLLAATILSALHWAVRSVGRIEPPTVKIPSGPVVHDGDVRRFEGSYVIRRGQLFEVGLRGTPEAIGAAHANLLRPEMVANEGVLFGAFDQAVPSSVLRTMLLDLAVWRYRHVDQGMSDARLRELAASAKAFQPDPYASVFPTFQRMVYLSALYDISLSFEHSPLIGCTSFFAGPSRTIGDGVYLARAFDFEVDPIFDEQKAVFFVREDGRIPFASVAWPGLVGVVSGMNLEGVAVVVHGARAGPVHEQGEPVVQSLRRVLGTARTTEEAIARLAERGPMVSHLVIIADAAGRGVVVERVPDHPDFVRDLPELAAVSNHLEGPLASHEKNQRVRQATSTLDRRARGDALIEQAPPEVGVVDLVGWLRDRHTADGSPLPLGDRRAIDALIATHGVVMDAKEQQLWVSESPHLLGRFVQFDLRTMLAAHYRPNPRTVRPSVPPDPLLTSGEYRRWLDAGGNHRH